MSKRLNTVKVMFQDSQYNYETNVSAETTKESAERYFLNTLFDVGVFPAEKQQECTSIEFIDNNLIDTITQEIAKLTERKDMALFQRKITTQLSTAIEYDQEINSIDLRIEQLNYKLIAALREENEQVLNFIKEYQSKNEYNPKFLNEYNAKFNAEFSDFLKSNNFHSETLKNFN